MKNSQKVYPAKFQRSRGFVIPLIIAIVAILAIGGVVFVSTNKKVKAPVDNTVATSTDVTASWKTYTNSQYGFEISFPSGWRVDSTSPSNTYLISSTTDKMVKDFPNQPATQRVDLSISVSLDPQRPLGTKKNITFNGMNAEQVTQESEEGIWTSLYLDKNGYTYIITPVKKSNIGEQILSTFKFIETKTCSNGATNYPHCNADSTFLNVSANQTTLQLWPDVKSFDLTNKTFEAKGIGKDTQTTKNIKVYTNNLTKFSSKDMQISMNNFQDMYTMLKNWVGPEWWFNVTGTYQKDGSFLASNISIAVQ